MKSGKLFLLMVNIVLTDIMCQIVEQIDELLKKLDNHFI